MDLTFEDLALQYRRELHTHCYRMLGNLSESEDVVQEALLKAWRGLSAFEGRASVRTWLLRIATNACLDALDKRGPRLLPLERFDPADPSEALGPPLPQDEMIDPYPGQPWGIATGPRGDERVIAKESVALAFIAALERLPPLQRAALVLRDVLELSAAETAELLGKSTSAVESALDRARAGTAARKRHVVSKTEHPALLHRYLAAWEAKDAGALTELLREDATLTMPPLAAWFSGRTAIAAFIGGLMGRLPELRGRIIEIAGGPGVAIWARAPGEDAFVATSLSALTIEGDVITAIDTFLSPALFEKFGLPQTL